MDHKYLANSILPELPKALQFRNTGFSSNRYGHERPCFIGPRYERFIELHLHGAARVFALQTQHCLYRTIKSHQVVARKSVLRSNTLKATLSSSTRQQLHHAGDHAIHPSVRRIPH